MMKRLNDLGFKDMDFNMNCDTLSLGAFIEVSQTIIKLNLKSATC